MNRREFVKTTALVSALPLVSRINAAENFSTGIKEHSVIKPPRLKEGNIVGLVAPGSFVDKDAVDETVENLRGLGLEAHYTDNLMHKSGYLAGSDENRAEDLNYMFQTDKVDAIMCVRGGYGCTRILPLLDYDLIRKNPKILIGYSDVTALLYALYAETGLVSFHGPVGISTFNDYSVDYMRRTIMEPQSKLELVSTDEDEDEDAYKAYTITEGTAEGRLIGGNLTMMDVMIGTKYDVSYKNKIVFIEEVREEPYRVDRMLTRMRQAGKFDGAAGIVCGVFKKCEVDKDDPSFDESYTLKEVMQDRLGDLGIPVIYGLSFGHIENKFTLPVGINTRLDTSDETLTLLESAVV